MNHAKGRLLLVTHGYAMSAEPPIGTGRPRSLAKYLSRLGYEVTVLTSDVGVRAPAPPGVRVLATRDLLSSRLNWRAGRPSELRGMEPSRISRIAVPDVMAVSWLPFALGAALRLVRSEGTDCVLTTSPPESVHVVGSVLRRRGVPWIADLRDGWRFESYRQFPLGLMERFDATLERTLLAGADRIVTVTEPISADLEARLGRAVSTITNGFDPEPAVDGGGGRLLDPGRHSLVYTGRLGRSRAALDGILAGLRRLLDSDPRSASRLELVVAGPLSDGEQALLSDRALAEIVRTVGVVPHASALGLQRAADSLLLLTADGRPSVATGKLFEYLEAGRPILVVGEGTQAGAIASDVGAGLVVPAGDEEAIASALADLASGNSGGFDANAVRERAEERYSYPSIAKRIAREIEGARAQA